jgi:hypothetical protein
MFALENSHVIIVGKRLTCSSRVLRILLGCDLTLLTVTVTVRGEFMCEWLL